MTARATMAMLLAVIALAPLIERAAAQPSGERDRIAAERTAAKAQRVEQERACREQFVVTSCLDAARNEERTTLARLRRAELVLDDAERRESAVRRRQAIQDRAAARAEQAASQASDATRRDEPRPAPTPHPIFPTPHAAASGPGGDSAAREAEQRSAAAFEARERATQAHRAEVAKRNAARAASGKVAAPLPAPPGASAP